MWRIVSFSSFLTVCRNRSLEIHWRQIFESYRNEDWLWGRRWTWRCKHSSGLKSHDVACVVGNMMGMWWGESSDFWVDCANYESVLNLFFVPFRRQTWCHDDWVTHANLLPRSIRELYTTNGSIADSESTFALGTNDTALPWKWGKLSYLVLCLVVYLELDEANDHHHHPSINDEKSCILCSDQNTYESEMSPSRAQTKNCIWPLGGMQSLGGRL